MWINHVWNKWTADLHKVRPDSSKLLRHSDSLFICEFSTHIHSLICLLGTSNMPGKVLGTGDTKQTNL